MDYPPFYPRHWTTFNHGLPSFLPKTLNHFQPRTAICSTQDTKPLSTMDYPPFYPRHWTTFNHGLPSFLPKTLNHFQPWTTLLSTQDIEPLSTMDYPPFYPRHWTIFNHGLSSSLLQMLNHFRSYIYGCSHRILVSMPGATRATGWFWSPTGGRDSSVVRAPDLWLKGHGFESLQEWWKNFLLQG